MAHNGGCNSVSWGPDVAVGGSLGTAAQGVVKKFVTGGCDNRIRVWGYAFFFSSPLSFFLWLVMDEVAS